MELRLAFTASSPIEHLSAILTPSITCLIETGIVLYWFDGNKNNNAQTVQLFLRKESIT